MGDLTRLSWQGSDLLFEPKRGARYVKLMPAAASLRADLDQHSADARAEAFCGNRQNWKSNSRNCDAQKRLNLVITPSFRRVWGELSQLESQQCWSLATEPTLSNHKCFVTALRAQPVLNPNISIYKASLEVVLYAEVAIPPLQIKWEYCWL